jgi:hypothetical protein
MLIAYQYVPALHDLWLYEDHVITWTFPTAGSANIKRPYAWNPGSALYPYRKSIQAMPAVYRILGSPSGFPSYGVNLASDPVNIPVFWNSYCPWKAFFFSNTLGIQSEHWQATDNYRTPANNFSNVYVAGSFLIASTNVRYIAHDDTIYDLPLDAMMWPYRRTSAAFGSVWAFGSMNQADIAICECPSGIPVPPMQLIDARKARFGAPCWMVDSNFKVVQLNWNGCYDSVEFPAQDFSTRTSPTLPPVQLFTHDSGSVAFVEIRPPTSAAAGDGILGLLGVSVKSAGDLVTPVPMPIALIPPEDHASEPAVLYQQSLGNQFPQVVPPQRESAQPLASQSIALQISNLLTQIG